ncbi:MAG: menaquinol-cytochrome C reductase [Chloroflexi bacterium]|nr:menaquinol-cytochrome C reductase [Chloroflexota bacterium]
MQLNVAGPRQAEARGKEQKVHRLLAVVRKEVVATIDKDPENAVPVWPHLVVLEFLAAAIFGIGLFVTSWLVNAPLVALANPDKTPNPAKAPWYFLNLQELLLHMDPALAGVIVPGLAVVALMALPYLDDAVEDPGRWFTSRQGLVIAVFSTVFTAAVLPALILFDHFVGVKRLLTGVPYGPDIAGWIVPVVVMIVLPVMLVALVRLIWRASRRDVLIALFTGFFVTYIVLTIIGTAFRGPGMELFWPWEIPPHVE